MRITIEITGETYEAVAAQVFDLASRLREQAPESGPAEQEAPKRRGRPRKQSALAEALAAVQTAAARSGFQPQTETPQEETAARDPGPGPGPDPSPVPPQILSADDVRAALGRLVNAHGMDAVGVLLSEKGASRVSQLKPEDYADVIARCPA